MTSTWLALLSGGLLALSFPKFGTPALAWIALTPLIVAVAGSTAERRGPAHVFRLGVLAGLVYYCGTLYWVVGVMRTYGGLQTVVSVLVALLLASYLALYVGLFAWLLNRAIVRFGLSAIWWAPFLWVAAEWVRSSVGGGFPWALLGSSQATVIPIVQAASVVGVYGLSAMVALVATAAATVAISPHPARWRGAVAVALVLIGVAAGGLMRVSGGALTSGGESIRVGLVQGSIDQDDKHNPQLRAAILDRYLDLSRQALALESDIVIWPEAATPFVLSLEAQLAAPIRRLASEARTPFLIGTDEYERGEGGTPDRYYNAAALIGPDGRSRGLYRKMQLVPFGEYVPLKRLLFFVGPLIEAVSDFSAGDEAVVFDAEGRRMSVAICYESVYPWIARAFVARGSELLVTITNDAWFGRSSAAYQHFEQGALRAVEQGRYVVRAANTGISGAVDPYGRVLARTDLFVPTAIAVDVRLIDTRTVYSHIGDVVVWFSLAIVGLVLIADRMKKPV
jgi:apolipoprotein N-acyltransferase